MLAFFLWSRTIDPERTVSERRSSLIGMTLALAAGISTNYFAVLAFFPIAVGELARPILHLRKSDDQAIFPAFDLRVWAALVLAGMPLFIYCPLIAHLIAEFAPYAWNKVSLDQVFDSYTEIVEVILYPILSLFVFAVLAQVVNFPFSNLCAECRSEIRPRWFASCIDKSRLPWPVPPHESRGPRHFPAQRRRLPNHCE